MFYLFALAEQITITFAANLNLKRYGKDKI